MSVLAQGWRSGRELQRGILEGASPPFPLFRSRDIYHVILSHNPYMFLKQYVGCDISINKENEDPANNGERLNRNSYLRYNVDNENISNRLPGTI
jgi:hypothetical protein